MASNIHSPLLNTSTRTNFTSKFLLFLLSISAIIISCVFLAPSLIRSSSDPLQVCNQAHDPQSCLAHISSEFLSHNQQLDTLALLKIFLTKSLPQMTIASHASAETHRRIKVIGNHKDNEAVADCIELIDMSIDRTTSTLAAVTNWKSQSDADNAHSWLSGILTNHITCLDGLADSDSSNKTMQFQSMKQLVGDLISRTRTALALLASLSSPEDVLIRSPRGGFPSWISGGDRRLLGGSSGNIQANVVVAKDGSGKYKTIKEAVDAAPDKSAERYVIYVKKGLYKENVEVGKKKTNLMIYGDGMDSTIITGSLNVVDGSTTFRSATLAVAGDGFILQDIRVENTAGPQKHQAVALRVSADQSVINRCNIDAYQDTLYTHNFRQFYRDSLITGTVDFIFGNAAAVLQNCQIVARKPMDNQKNMVTAQGRVDPNQNTGISIQACDVIPSSDLSPVKNSFPTYLGRPWKAYSRTVFMQSYIDSHIDPAGWAEWDKDFALKTLYYGEFANRGPGAGTSKRVKWPGYHVITDPNEAKKFTVAELIQGQMWLSSTGVSYTEGL